MTSQKQKFADQYLVLNNGTKAAIAAGYSKKSARSKASQLLVDPEIESYIENGRKLASEKAIVDASWVQQRFMHISDACVKAKPVMQWDAQSKSFIPVQDENGDPVYQFDSSGANKATEMLGKIIGVFEKDNKQREPVLAPVINIIAPDAKK